jgi:hypothetical protein
MQENGQTNECKTWRTYSGVEELIANLPYVGMGLLGAAVLIVSVRARAYGGIAAAAYLLYCAAGAFWIILFVCPYCQFWNTRSCPCGYGRISGRLRKQRDASGFKEKFKKHIPVIVPLWFIPVVVGVIGLIGGFSWLFLLLVVVFVIDAFVVLPLVSTKHGCVECPQRDSCPWMESRGATGMD